MAMRLCFTAFYASNRHNFTVGQFRRAPMLHPTCVRYPKSRLFLKRDLNCQETSGSQNKKDLTVRCISPYTEFRLQRVREFQHLSSKTTSPENTRSLTTIQEQSDSEDETTTDVSTSSNKIGSKAPDKSVGGARASSSGSDNVLDSIFDDFDVRHQFASHEDYSRSLGRMRGDPLERWGGRVVGYRGSPDAKLMIVGEAPGRDEDRVGKPFVGRAGLLLDDIFTYAGFDMDRHVYITNVAKRRPPENRTPTPEEVDYYLPLLMEEIRLVDPAIIILAGATPLRAILNLSGISKVRGQKFAVEYAGRARDVMPIFHPAYLLRNAIKKHEMKVDVDAIRALYIEKFPDEVLAEPRKKKPRRQRTSST